MAILKNTTITGTEYLQITKANTGDRPVITPVVQTFTSVGTTNWTAPAGVSEIEVLVVAGGGGGGGYVAGGGGGAGGVIYRPNFAVTPETTYTITVGAGGGGGRNSTQTGSIDGLPGGNSVFDTLTALGGGGGSRNTPGSGGSGGGGSLRNINGGAGTPGQGFSGGASVPGASSTGGGGGGGGAGGPGSTGIFQHATYVGNGGGGGAGLNFLISGTSTWYAGGGGGGGRGDLGVLRGGGGIGGGGLGQDLNNLAQPGQANTGGGGGGGGGSNDTTSNGAAGGSGIVIIKYSITVDNQDPIGLIRYNTNFNGLEIYEGNGKGWVAENPTKNYSGHNLVRYSNTVGTTTDTVWNSLNGTDTITLNAAADLFGGSRATIFSGNGSSTSRHTLTALATGHLAFRFYTFSVFVKARGNQRYVGLETASYSHYTNPGGTYFDLQTGTRLAGGIPGTITSYGDGWYRITATAQSGASTFASGGWYINAVDAAGSNTVTLGTADGYFLFGAQDEEATFAGPYTPTQTVRSRAPGEVNGYRIHRYTEVGTTSFVPACTGLVDVLVVAGGGGGGSDNAGGGGGGGVIYQTGYRVISGNEYTITIGAGGAGSTTNVAGVNGGNSRFGLLTAIGGGGGGGGDGNGAQTPPILDLPGRAGGSGGGGASEGNAPGGPGVEGQGYRGGDGVGGSGGGGGGSGGRGENALSSTAPGNGGPGTSCDITGSIEWYGGGGGGATENSAAPLTNSGLGGLGGGGRGNPGTAVADIGSPGTPNTGGGGGGSSYNGADVLGGNGGSGIVVVRYRII
jgi:hypothetical protein